jgi:3',5'-cyclic AMP phosphodiesterase CpdA
LVAPGLKLYGLDPRARLDAAIADINKHHADAEVAVVTGDLTHWGEVEAYRNFLHSMRALQVPYVVPGQCRLQWPRWSLLQFSRGRGGM